MRLGRYELLYRLARGGMGEVYVARRRGPGDIEKRVVIKRIRRDLSGDPRFVEMFLREAKVSMTLSHKNIAAVFDFGRAGQELFLAMEHIHGRDLGRVLAAARREKMALSATAAAHIGIEVCRALDYAQRAGTDAIIHRDLSPKNLLLSFSGEVVVADFGLAIDTRDQAASAGVRGTPAYLSPEQARGEPLDARSDLFSLGLVLREIVTGEAVYAGGEAKEIIEKARRAEIEPLGDTIEEGLREAINKATARDLSERFKDARAMQVALDGYLVGARAGGASAPAQELADLLAALFADKESEREAIGDGPQVAAVTFLDDGDDAVAQSVLAEDSGISLAQTVGDSELGALPPAAASGRKWQLAAFAALIGIAAATIAYLASRAPPAQRSPLADAGASLDANSRDAPATLDAANPPLVDAATLDAPAPAHLQPGWLRIQSQPWARVAIAGTRGCAETPCRIRLRPGRHAVKLINPVTGATATRFIDIAPNETTDLSVTLE